MPNPNLRADLTDGLKSIKLQILDRVVAVLLPLKAENRFRDVRREFNPTIAIQQKPTLLIYDGPESYMKSDVRGRQYQFDINLEMHFSAQELGRAKDYLVPQVQQLIEADIQLAGLCNIVAGGDEQPFVSELGSPDGGVLLTYTIQYRRVLGNPHATY